MSDRPPTRREVLDQLTDWLIDEFGARHVALAFERSKRRPVPVSHQSQIRTERPGDHSKDDTAPLLEMARLIERDGVKRWNAAWTVAGSMRDSINEMTRRSIAKRLDRKFKENGRSFQGHCLAIMASMDGWPDSLQTSAQAGRWMLYHSDISDSSLERLRIAAARGMLLDRQRFHSKVQNEPN
jgi:hypothetical protein